MISNLKVIYNNIRFPFSYHQIISRNINSGVFCLDCLRISRKIISKYFVSQGYETLLRLASRYGVCFAAQIRVDVKHFKTNDYDQVLGKLQSQSQSRIVVLFSGKSCAAQLMAATKRVTTKNAKPLIWVGCDGWSSRDVVTTGKNNARYNVF